MMKRHAPTILAVLVAAAFTMAGPIHTWTTGEVITSSDLNANFSHIHNTMVGGHGPRLMNSDVSSGAAISHSKLATPALIPKVWAQVDCTTVSNTCSLTSGSGVSSVTWNSAGSTTITFSAARANVNYGTLITAYSSSSSSFVSCYDSSHLTTQMSTMCSRSNPDGGVTDAPVNSNFTVLLMDDNN